MGRCPGLETVAIRLHREGLSELMESEVDVTEIGDPEVVVVDDIPIKGGRK